MSKDNIVRYERTILNLGVFDPEKVEQAVISRSGSELPANSGFIASFFALNTTWTKDMVVPCRRLQSELKNFLRAMIVARTLQIKGEQAFFAAQKIESFMQQNLDLKVTRHWGIDEGQYDHTADLDGLLKRLELFDKMDERYIQDFFDILVTIHKVCKYWDYRDKSEKDPYLNYKSPELGLSGR